MNIFDIKENCSKNIRNIIHSGVSLSLSKSITQLSLRNKNVTKLFHMKMISREIDPEKRREKMKFSSNIY